MTYGLIRPLTLLILGLAARPSGCRYSEVDRPKASVSRELLLLVAEGRLFRCQISHRNVKFFTTQAMVEQSKPGVTIVHRHRQGVTFRRDSKGWGPDDEMHITPETKRTDCPTRWC